MGQSVCAHMHVCAFIHTYTHWILWVGEYLIGRLWLRVTSQWGTVGDSTLGPVRTVTFVLEPWIQMPSTCHWNSQSICVCLFIHTCVHVHSTGLVLSQRTTWRNWFSPPPMYVLEGQLRLDGEGLYLPRSLFSVLQCSHKVVWWWWRLVWAHAVSWWYSTSGTVWSLSVSRRLWWPATVLGSFVRCCFILTANSPLSSARLGKGALK